MRRVRYIGILNYIVLQIEIKNQQLSFIAQKKLDILCNSIKLLLNTRNKLRTEILRFFKELCIFVGVCLRRRKQKTKNKT